MQKINLTSKKVSWVFVILLVINGGIQTLIFDNERAKDERWEFRGMKLGETLKKTFPDQTLIAVTAAGCIPYSSELPVVDMLGLNDYYIPRHPPKNFGKGSLAHELGDANYVMNRNPDIIIFNTGGNLSFNIGNQLKTNKVFNNNYIKAKTIEKKDEYQLFFNKYGKNTGIRNNGNQLIIPGYLFQAPSDNGDASCVFTGNKLIKIMEKESSYILSLDNLFPEDWKTTDSQEKNTGFTADIRRKNGQLIIEIVPKNNMFLESLVLERKY